MKITVTFLIVVIMWIGGFMMGFGLHDAIMNLL